MKKVLMSACLLGQAVRWDGGHRAQAHPVLRRWLALGRVVSLCPEVAGGLPVPRPRAERLADGRVVTEAGEDVSEPFARGAARAVALARQHGVTVAVLKEGSPSCGSSVIADGTFSGHRVEGQGVTAQALRAAGVQVFSEAEFEAADAALGDDAPA